jgi:fumarate reductase flavoprotein subunit
MAKQFNPLVEAGKITLLLNGRVSLFLASDAGAVEGVRIGDRAIRGRHTVLTTGGYAMNPEMFERMVGQPAYAAGSYPQSQGDGQMLATAVGAALRNRHLHRPGTGSIMSADKFPATAYARFNTVVDKRPPWEIWVNAQGERFIREDTANPYTLSRALFRQPRLKYAIVFDEAILRESPVGIPGWTVDKMREHFGTHLMFHRADSLDELAAKAGLAPAGLSKTVAAYNAASRAGSGDAFGRAHMPKPIAEPPYYAIIHLGHSATSAVGVVVDKDLRALTAGGQPIKGLYAAGEVLGSGVTLGDAFVPGMMLTPAMTQGRLLGERLPIGA